MNVTMPTIVGKMRVYLEVVPGIGAWDTLVGKIRQLSTADLARVVLAYGHESELSLFKVLPKGVPEPVRLGSEGAAQAILARQPSMVILPRLVVPELDVEEHVLFHHALEQVLEGEATVETTLSMMAYDGVNDVLTPALKWPAYAQVTGTFLRNNVSDYVVCDVPPQQILNRYLAGDVKGLRRLMAGQSEVLNVSNLHRLRELMLRLVVAHVGDVTKRQVNLSNNQLSEAESLGHIWQWRWKEILCGLAIVFGTTLVVSLPWVTGVLSTTAAALAITGAILVSILQFNATTGLAVSAVGVLMYVVLLINPLTANTTIPWLQVGDVVVMALLTTVSLIAANMRTLRESGILLREEHTKAMLRLVYDTSYLKNTPDILTSAANVLRRSLGFKVVYAVLEGGALKWVGDETELSASEQNRARSAMEQDTILGPQEGEKEGYLWCPVQSGQGVLGAVGVKNFNGESLDRTYQTTVFMRAYTRLMASSIWRVEIDQERSEANIMANRENLRSSLLASVSHDLKTPLVSIIGSLSTLSFVKDGMPQEERNELVASAYHEAERLHRIVHNVLEMAKLESGMVLPSKEPVELVDSFRLAAERVRRSYPHFKMTVDSQLSQTTAVGDELLLSQVFYNLLENAAKYGGKKPEVKVELSEDSASKKVQVRVIDNGPGIAQDEIPRVFDKFYRSSFTDHKQAGSGLGLAICRAVVEAHGGTIEAMPRSDKAQGMVFAMALPGVEVRAEA